MTKEEYKAKIAEIDKQEAELESQRMKTNKEFTDSLLKELEEQGITPGTKVLVKIKYWWQKEDIKTENYFLDVRIPFGEVKYIFHKAKKDGTMSHVEYKISGEDIISIHKI